MASKTLNQTDGIKQNLFFKVFYFCKFYKCYRYLISEAMELTTIDFAYFTAILQQWVV